jgi:hypothetical protein
VNEFQGAQVKETETWPQWLTSVLVVLVILGGVGTLLWYAMAHHVEGLPAAWGVMGSLVAILGALVAPPPESKIKVAIAKFIDDLGGAVNTGGARLVNLLWFLAVSVVVLFAYNAVWNHGLLK